MAETIQEVWKKTCTLLREKLSPDVYERWIAVIHPREMVENRMVLNVANDFYSTWLEENYLPLIQKAVGVVTGRQCEIQMVVDRQAVQQTLRLNLSHEGSDSSKQSSVPSRAEPAESSKPEPRSAGAAANRRELRRQEARRDSRLNPNYVFETFVVGNSNNFAHAASLAVAQSPAKAYNPLFIYGGVGLGKTHLMQAVGNYVIEQAHSRICYISSEEFTNEYIDSIKRNKIEEFRRKYRGMDILLIDDMQFLAGKEGIQEEFFHTFNALFDGHKQIVMTCDRPANEIPGLAQRLVSRFEWGLVVELEPPNIETRMAILGKKAQSMGADISPEVIEYLARRISANIRRMEGALVRITSYQSLMPERSLAIPDLERLLKDMLDEEDAPEVNMERIQRAVADHFDIRYTDILSKKRPASIALPRQVAMFLCREITQHSFPEIGDAFGKNHATVMHACRSIESRCRRDVSFREKLDALKLDISRNGKSFSS